MGLGQCTGRPRNLRCTHSLSSAKVEAIVAKTATAKRNPVKRKMDIAM